MNAIKSFFKTFLERGGRIPTTMLFMAGFGFLIIFAFGFNSLENYSLKVTQCFILGMASAMTGTFIGFLFGIPKQTAKNVEGRYTSNTNLEEISDWLTKILVGLGLTQLGSIPVKFQSLIDNLSSSIVDVPKNMIGCIIVYFLIIGFFSGYLITRLYLSGEFAKAEDKLQELSDKVNKYSSDEQPVRIDDQINQRQDLVNTEDILNQDIEKPVTEIISETKQLEQDGIKIPSAQYFKQGRIMVINKNYETGREYFQKSYDIDGHYKSGNNLAVILSRFLGKFVEAEKILSELIASRPKDPLAYYNRACNYVRMNEFEKAIQSLDSCITLAKESYLSEAQKDSTFEPLKDREDFKKLVPNYAHE